MLEKLKQEAKEFVVRAIHFCKHSSNDIALAEFTNTKGPFVQNERYIFVLDTEGTMLAHGVNEKYVGKNFIDLRDSAGKSFIREIVEVANAEGGGWIDYQWYNPLTKETKPKNVYFEKVDDLIICSGVYVEKWLDFISYNLRYSVHGVRMDSTM